jgi:hypothetical protein
MANRQCPHCGKVVFDRMTQCPYCREALGAVPQIHGDSVRGVRGIEGRGKIRQGLLCILLAAVIHYFAGGYSAMQLPYPIDPLVTVYFSPLLLLSGLGLSSFGFYLWRMA